MNNLVIRTRLETLCRERGKQWYEIYKILGWDKGFASRVLNGITIPLLPQRVALAKVLGVDSTVIWNETDLITALKMEELEHGSKM